MRQRLRRYWRVVFAIFRRDLKRLVTNPVALLLVAGACVLPSAYGWYLTLANWDPYERTDGVAVAVANEDAGAEVPGVGSLDAGEAVVAGLRENHELGWRFYDSADQGVAAVESGECFAAVVIPEGFSRDLAGVLTDDEDPPTLDYYLNEKISAAAPNFTDAGVAAIKEQVDASFVKTVATAAIDKGVAVAGAAGAAGASGETDLAGAVQQATDALGSVRSALADAGPALASAADAAEKSGSALADLAASLPQLRDAAQRAQDALASADGDVARSSLSLAGAMGSAGAELGTAATEAGAALGATSSSLIGAEADARQALAGARAAQTQTSSLVSALEPLAADNAEVAGALEALKSADAAASDMLGALEGDLSAVSDTAKGLLDVARTVNVGATQGAASLSSGAEALREKLAPDAGGALSSLSAALGATAGLVGALEPAVASAQASVQGLASAVAQAQAATGDATSAIDAASESLEGTLAAIRELQASSLAADVHQLSNVDAERTAAFLADPVALDTVAVYPVKNYGSGVCPFFTNVGLWVAGFVFLGLFKLRVDPDGLPDFSPTQAYLGRWLLLMLLAVFPPLIACGGDVALGIQCESPAAFVFAGVVAGLVYVNLIYALAQAFRYVGKALAALLLFLQIPGSSGLYPVQMMPELFSALHPWLPFSYAIDAMREAVAGFYGLQYWQDLAVLVLLFVPAGLFIGLVVGKWAYNLTLLLDREAADSGLFQGEQAPAQLRYRQVTILRLVLRDPEYRERLADRAAWFERHYRLLKRIAWAGLALQFVAVPVLIALVRASVGDKLLLLAWLVAVVVVTDAYLIVIAFLHVSLPDKLRVLDADDTDQMRQIKETGSSHRGAGEGVRQSRLFDLSHPDGEDER